jgi:hypothetical protein
LHSIQNQNCSIWYILTRKTWYSLSHIGLYSVIPTSYVWDKSLQYLFCCGFHFTFNLESNEMLSDFLVFYFFTNVYLAYSWQNGKILLSLGRKSKHSYISINNFLDGYKEWTLCLCSHQCIRNVMMQRMQVSKGI